MSANRKSLLVARSGGRFAVPPTTLVPNGARVSLLTPGHNIYAQGLVYRGGTLYLFTTEATSEHASDSAAYVRTVSGFSSVGSRTSLYAGGGAGRHGGCEFAFVTQSGRVLVGLHDQSNSNLFDVVGKLIYSDDMSSWSSPYTVPNSFSGDCVPSPPCQLGDGTILMPTYGEQTGVVGGNTFCRLVKSTDDGATFGSETLIAQSASRTYQEPRLYALASGVVCLMRSDTDVHTWMTNSTNSGSSFPAASDVLAMSGPPDAVPIASDSLFIIGRNDNTVFRGRTAASTNAGSSWTSPAELDTGETRELDGTAWAYLGNGEYVSVYALATSPSSSELCLRRWTAA